MSLTGGNTLGRALKVKPYFETVEKYQLFFSRICDTIRPVIGEMTLRSILSNMLSYAAERYPSFSDVELHGIHINFYSLQDTHVPELQEKTLEALEFFFEEFIALIGELTSDYYTETLKGMAKEILMESPH